jgi:hypothetical protein
MQLNLPMVKRVARRLAVRRAPDFHSFASREWILCPPERATVPPALFLPGAIERVRALSPWRNWDTERSLLAGGSIEHAASVARMVPDVELAGAYLYRGAAKFKPGFGEERVFGADPGPAERLDEVHLMTSQAGSHFFGTLMLDDMPLNLIPEPGSPCIAMMSKPYVHEAGYRELLGLPRPREVARARIRRLMCYTDFAQNSFKRARYELLRARLRAALGPQAGRVPPPGVYLRRGIGGEPRRLVNEAELEQALLALEFDILDPENLSAQDVARRSLDARVVIAVEGSHLSHAIFSAAEQATFLVIQPPERFALAYKEYTDRMDMRFALVVAEPAPGGFRVVIDEVHRLLELLS